MKKENKIFGLTKSEAIAIIEKHGANKLLKSGKEDPIVETVSKTLFKNFVK